MAISGDAAVQVEGVKLKNAFCILAELGVRHITVDRLGWDRIAHFSKAYEQSLLYRNPTTERDTRIYGFGIERNIQLLPEHNQHITSIVIYGVRVECQ